MPEYLAPGVFVEEVSFRHKSIEGVGTSVAALVGPTRTGPLRGRPEALTSYAEFERIYGDANDLAIGADVADMPNFSAHAARAFFDNGGKQLFVARVFSDINGLNPDSNGIWPNAARKADTGNTITFFSRFPGKVGDYTLELRWRDSEDLLRSESTDIPSSNGLYFLETQLSVPITDGSTSETKDLAVRAVVRLKDGALTIVGSHAEISPPNAISLDKLSLPSLDKIRAGSRFTRIHARAPASGALLDGTSAELHLGQSIGLALYAGSSWGNLTVLRGTLDASGETFTVAAQPLNPGVSAPFKMPLAALAASSGAAHSMIVLRSFDIDVHRGDKDGEVIRTYAGLSTAASGATSLATALPANPDLRAEALGSPIACIVAADATGQQIQTALVEMCDATALHPNSDSLDEPRYLIALSGGSDGAEPGAGDYAGETDEVKGSTGLKALEDIEDVSMVMAPAAAAAEETIHTGVVLEMQKHVRRMRYRIGIVDSRKDQSIGEVRAFASNFDDSRLALYYPWVVSFDPTGARRDIALPPSGFIAGIYARTDVERGVHKAPANEVVFGALRFDQQINSYQQELLNPNGINVLRSFAGRGHRVWGARTLSSDPEWKYVNVRRYFLYLERSIEKSTQWAVFEPNGEALWANIRSSAEDFLFSEWRNGRLLGSTPKEAYFVRCDRSTMTQNDIDNGRMVCLIGVAALKPAEFVIFRIGQKTADA